jgi:hypothetical protein
MSGRIPTLKWKLIALKGNGTGSEMQDPWMLFSSINGLRLLEAGICC